MTERGLGKVNTYVNRQPATKVWSAEHRWGQMIGDVRTLKVTRTDGGQMTLSYGKDTLEIREDLIEPLVKMVNEAAGWEDETDG